MKKSIIHLLCFLPLLWLGSCSESIEEIDYNPNVLSSKDYIRAEDAMLEIVNTFLKGVHDTLVENTNYGYIDYCDVSYYPDDNLIYFRYGGVNRMCQDSKFRRGSFLAYFSGPVYDAGVTANITTDSLFVDDSLVEAEINIRYNGINSNELPEYSLEVVYCKIKLQDTTKINRINIAADFTMVWNEGSLTPPIHEDDIYLISGTASGVSSDGYEFYVDIQEPLLDYLDCYWISQGKSKITVPSGLNLSGDIDYISEDGCYNEMHFYFNNNLFFDYIK